jgi:hypothetical protein
MHPGRGARSWTTTNLGAFDLGSAVSLSCASRRLCVAVDDFGNVISSAKPAGGADQWHALKLDAKNVMFCTCDAYAVGLTGVSCPTTTYCAAVDGAGNVLVADERPAKPRRSSWRITRVGGTVDSAGWLPLSGISCRTRLLCLAFDFDGNIMVGTPKRVAVPARPACDREMPAAGVAGSRALIYAIGAPTGTDYFGCRRPGGVSYPLGQTAPPIAEYGSNHETGDFVLAGNVVGAQTEDGLADTVECSKYDGLGCPAPRRSITVLDTSTGRQVEFGTGSAAGNVVVSASDAVAWLEPSSDRSTSTLLAAVLHPSGATGFTASPQHVDTGPIDPRSLRFSGLTLSWTNAGHPESATLH